MAWMTAAVILDEGTGNDGLEAFSPQAESGGLKMRINRYLRLVSPDHSDSAPPSLAHAQDRDHGARSRPAELAQEPALEAEVIALLVTLLLDRLKLQVEPLAQLIEGCQRSIRYRRHMHRPSRLDLSHGPRFHFGLTPVAVSTI
jgi:hypothetical protein